MIFIILMKICSIISINSTEEWCSNCNSDYNENNNYLYSQILSGKKQNTVNNDIIINYKNKIIKKVDDQVFLENKNTALCNMVTDVKNEVFNHIHSNIIQSDHSIEAKSREIFQEDKNQNDRDSLLCYGENYIENYYKVEDSNLEILKKTRTYSAGEYGEEKYHKKIIIAGKRVYKKSYLLK